MKYIITGATSFVGSTLVAELLSRGHEVIAVCRKDSGKEKNLPNSEKMSIVYCDLQHMNTIHEIILDADIFVHLAWGGTTQKEREIADIHEQNVKYALDAMISASKIGCKVFLDAGSQAEYGFINELTTEETPCNPETEYGKAKLKVWQVGEKLSQELGIKYIHIRIFSAYGEKDRPNTLLHALVLNLLNNKDMDLSSCQQSWNYVYVKDAVYMISDLCEYAYRTEVFTPQVYHIASLDTRPLKEFIEEVKALVPDYTGTLNYASVVPAHQVSLQPSIEKTLLVSKVKFTPFGEVMKSTINYLKQHD